MFLIEDYKKADEWSKDFSFNPLIQVYVFNQLEQLEKLATNLSFNPLIQVYVFNIDKDGNLIILTKSSVLIP